MSTSVFVITSCLCVCSFHSLHIYLCLHVPLFSFGTLFYTISPNFLPTSFHYLLLCKVTSLPFPYLSLLIHSPFSSPSPFFLLHLLLFTTGGGERWRLRGRKGRRWRARHLTASSFHQSLQVCWGSCRGKGQSRGWKLCGHGKWQGKELVWRCYCMSVHLFSNLNFFEVIRRSWHLIDQEPLQWKWFELSLVYSRIFSVYLLHRLVQLILFLGVMYSKANIDWLILF